MGLKPRYFANQETIKRLPALLVVFLFLAVLPARAQDYGDAIIDASISDARTLIPILASDSASSSICNMLYNGLVKFDKDLNVVGDLAQSWTSRMTGWL